MGGWERLPQETLRVREMMAKSCEDVGRKLDVSFAGFFYYDHVLVLHLVTTLSLTNSLQIPRCPRTWCL